MSWQLYFHHSLHVLLKSCSLQSLGTVLGDTPPEPAQELLLLNIPSPKPGAHLLCKTGSLSHQDDGSHIFFPFARSLGISISMCVMSQAFSPAPLGKMITLGREILPPWAALLRHWLCHRQVSLARGGTSLAPSSQLVPKSGMLRLTPKAVTDCGTAAAVCRVAGKQPVCFMSESHLILQAFKARCAGTVQHALQPLCSLWPACCSGLQPEESFHLVTKCGHRGFAPFLHLCQKAVEEFVFGQVRICTKDITVKHQGGGLWTNHRVSHEA